MVSNPIQFSFLFWFLWALIPTVTPSVNELYICDEEVSVECSTEIDYTIFLPGQTGGTYTPGASYTWCVSSPRNTTVSLLCEDLDIPKSPGCKANALTVSCSEDEPRSYCGTNPFHVQSSSNKIKITLHSNKKSRGGKFLCKIITEEPELYTMRAIQYEDCDCGYSSRLRIVGGEETGVNEFPFMAGIVDTRRGAFVLCGATIISSHYVLTADHCLDALEPSKTAVVVGEHNLSSSSETSATKIITVKRFIPYPYYDSTTKQYDIALIELISPIAYSSRVGPVCLPFMSRNWDLTGEYVTVLGWGTTEFGGPRSKVLQKANLDLINISDCIRSYGNDIDAYTQLCAYRDNADACQYDSGGPLVWFNYYINRYEIVGLVSYGRGCAAGIPSVNTKVAPFLQWILDSTPTESYCYKSDQ